MEIPYSEKLSQDTSLLYHPTKGMETSCPASQDKLSQDKLSQDTSLLYHLAKDMEIPYPASQDKLSQDMSSWFADQDALLPYSATSSQDGLPIYPHNLQQKPLESFESLSQSSKSTSFPADSTADLLTLLEGYEEDTEEILEEERLSVGKTAPLLSPSEDIKDDDTEVMSREWIFMDVEDIAEGPWVLESRHFSINLFDLS